MQSLKPKNSRGLVVLLALTLLGAGLMAGCGGGGGGTTGGGGGGGSTSFQAVLPTNPTGWTGNSLVLVNGANTTGYPNFAVGKSALTIFDNLQTTSVNGVGVSFSLVAQPPDVVEKLNKANAAKLSTPRRLPFDVGAWEYARLKQMAATHGIPTAPGEQAASGAAPGLKSGAPAGAIVSQAAESALTVGPTKAALRATNFWVFDFVANNYVSRTADLKVTGVNCYVYLDQQANVPQATLQAIADTFDANIYAQDRTVFGSEWKPGIDGDSRVFILITNAWDFAQSGGVAGYFDPSDEYANSPSNLHSNAREIFYLNPAFFDGFLEYAVLGHEFQHMINWNQRFRIHGVVEDTWLNEGLSRYAEDVVGFGTAQGNSSDATQLKEYLDFPEDTSLTNWAGTGANYGCAYLFVLYLWDHYGGQAVVTSIMQGSTAGMTNVANATGENFNFTFSRFSFANFFAGKVADASYNYTSLNINGTYGGVVLNGAQPFVGNPPASDNFNIGPYVARYYLIGGGNGSTLQVGVTGATGSLGVFEERN